LSIATYGAISAGGITTASTTTAAGTNPDLTVQSSSAASGGSGNITYLWRCTGMSAATLTGSAATYAIGNDASNYSSAGTYYINRYAKDATCNTAWMAASGTYTLNITINQPQGSCTFTQPPVVGTFAAFPSNYSASTFVTLTDERDNNNYTVVKIGTGSAGTWIMAQNLNYQKDLTWESDSNSPSTVTNHNIELIGHFWCPGGYSSSTGTSNRAACDVWGALYSWETAMMVDGKWTDDSKSASTWSEPSYTTYTSSGNTTNEGRGANRHGICPPNWHVPTDSEWGDIFNAMESGTNTNHNTGDSWRGTDAGSRGKSVCTVSDNLNTGNTYVNDTNANWYYHSFSNTLGTDAYGFRVLPAGCRNLDGSIFRNRGIYAYFWSSSLYSTTSAWYRYFYYGSTGLVRGHYNRAYGYSVRCIKN
jgi:uncharacterized protein (TIGR02145 family)